MVEVDVVWIAVPDSADDDIISDPDWLLFNGFGRSNGLYRLVSGAIL
jgi:hypothetical protein